MNKSNNICYNLHFSIINKNKNMQYTNEQFEIPDCKKKPYIV